MRPPGRSGGRGVQSLWTVVEGMELQACVPWHQDLDPRDSSAVGRYEDATFHSSLLSGRQDLTGFNRPLSHLVAPACRWGEALAYQYFLSQHPGSLVKWMNAEGESRAAYDFEVSRCAKTDSEGTGGRANPQVVPAGCPEPWLGCRPPAMRDEAPGLFTFLAGLIHWMLLLRLQL